MARMLSSNQKKREESDYANYTSFYTGLGANASYRPSDAGSTQRPSSAGATRRIHSGYANNNKGTSGMTGGYGNYDPRYGAQSGRGSNHGSAGSSHGEVQRKRTIWTPSGIQTEYYTEKVSNGPGSGNIPTIRHPEQHARPKSAGTTRPKSSSTPTSTPSVTSLPPAQQTADTRGGNSVPQGAPLLQPKAGTAVESTQVAQNPKLSSTQIEGSKTAETWNTSYKLHYGGSRGQQQYSNQAPPSEVQQSNSGFSSDGRPTHSAPIYQAGGQPQVVRANSAPASRPTSASSRARSGAKSGINDTGLDDDGIADDDEENEELDKHLREMAMGGLIGAGNRGDRPLTAFYEGNDDTSGGMRSRSRPEVSTTTPSQSVELVGDRDSGVLDLRNNSSLLSEQDINNRVSAGLSTVPNQFCSVREALELLKIIVSTKPGALSSSSMVMDMYMVGKVVGVGSYGKVRAAWHRLTGSKIAIKTYDKSKFKDPEHWKRVQSEIKIMEQLSHARIARLFDAVETPKRMHLIMECLEGGNLCSYVKSKKRLSEEESKRIFFQLVQSIEYLHSYSVIHRDVKLENVLFNDDKDVKLIDFGFSTVCQKGKRLRVFCGTPSYMAPEIVRRSEYEGKPVDMWSLGILLYAILCGYFPFRAKNYPDLYRRIARGVFDIPEELSSNAKDLIRQLLTMDPMQRITAPATMKHPWLQAQYANVPDMAKLRLENPILISEKASDDIDEGVLRELEEFGINRDELTKQILTKTHSATATLYYLLLDATVTARRNGTTVRGKGSVGSSAHLLQSHNSSSNAPSNGVGTHGSSGSGINWKKYGQSATYAPSPNLIARSDSPGSNLLQGVLNSRPKSASGGRTSSNHHSGSGSTGLVGGGGSSTGPATGHNRPRSANATRR